jgi:mannose-1-phosphate guanylyltransferase
LFNNTIIDKIELKPHFLERDIFPKLAQQGQLRSLYLQGFWKDIGQPKDFLTCIKYYLNFLREQQSSNLDEELILAKGDNIIGNVLIHPTAEIDPNSMLGPNVVIGANVQVGYGVRL